MPSNRRQMMQPWPLCLVSFSRSRDRSILPSQYSRVPRSSSSSRSTVPQDCASNTTLLTNTSPFNSQQTLISDKSKLSNHDREHELASSHYYAENLRHETDLRHSVPIYDPLSKDEDLTDYKQLEPLIFLQDSVEIGEASALMELQKTGDEETGDNIQSAPHVRAKKTPRFFSYTTQVLAALSVSFGSMVVGFASGYTSPTEESMQNATITSFEVTKDTFSWVGASMPLAALFGGIAGGPSIEYLGRRNTILATAFPFIGSWLMIAMATQVWMVLAGRALCGFCMGIATLSLPVYLGETLQPEIRGILGLLPTAFGNTGILICFTAGMFLNWYELAFLGACIPIPFLLLMFLIPETPRWYVSKGKTKKARKSLQWLRGKNSDISDELSAIEKTHVESEREASQNIIRELLKSNHVKPLLISLGLMFFQQMSGINAVIFYATGIFKDSGSSIDKSISTIIVGVVNFISTFVATTVIDRLGRKMLLYISSVSMIITLFCMGIFFYLQSQKYEVSTIGWLPLTSLVIYVIGFSLGFGPIPWLMMGEILPAKIRGPAASIATGFNWSCTFIVTKTFPIFTATVGSATTFWIFGAICVLGLVFVVLCVPETRGRSLEEIEKRLTGPVRRMSAVANMKPMPTAC